MHAGWLSDGVVTASWIAFAAATSVVASAAWPVVSRRNLRQIATAICGAGAVTVAVTLNWSFTFGWAVAATGCVFVVGAGLRNLDWTALGRGIAIYTAGTALVAVLAAGQIQRAVRHTPRAPPASVAERADRMARWTRTPAGEVMVDARWIAPPEGISTRGWVQAIARAYAPVASAPARN